MLRSTSLRAASFGRAASKFVSISLRNASRVPAPTLSHGLLRDVRSMPALQSVYARPCFYSSEAGVAEDAGAKENTPEILTRFSELSLLGVHPVVVDAIVNGMKYENMTPVQSQTIGPALTGKDVVAQAKTGTGKTLAFLAPVLHRILTNDPDLARRRAAIRARPDDIRAIIISPTRELAEQIGVEARKLCQGTGVIVQTAVGGTQKREMLYRTRQEGCHLLVGTPGRLNDLLEDQRSGVDAPRVSTLVLDEADRMLDVGFEQELRNILRSLPERSQVPRQTFLFSATIPRNVVSLAREYVDPLNFEFCQTVSADEPPTHEKVPQFIVPCKGHENLYPTLLELLMRENHAGRGGGEALPLKAIVYLPTMASVAMTAAVFNELRPKHGLPPVLCIHSKLTQAQRTRASENFRKARSAVLFSSDVTARGMDFPNVSHVIQVHLPSGQDQYIHRIGRTGRADKSGQGWLLVPEMELKEARRKLVGLPINKATGLEFAEMTLTRDAQKPELLANITEAIQRLPKFYSREYYLSLLGGAIKNVDKWELVENLNNFCTITCGLDQPPAVPAKSVANGGLGRIPGVRVETPQDRQSRDMNEQYEGDEFSGGFGGMGDGSYMRGSGGGFGWGGSARGGVGYGHRNGRYDGGGRSGGSFGRPSGGSSGRPSDPFGSLGGGGGGDRRGESDRRGRGPGFQRPSGF